MLSACGDSKISQLVLLTSAQLSATSRPISISVLAFFLSGSRWQYTGNFKLDYILKKTLCIFVALVNKIEQLLQKVQIRRRKRRVVVTWCIIHPKVNNDAIYSDQLLEKVKRD